MSTPLSLDLRVRVLAAVASGLSHRQAGVFPVGSGESTLREDDRRVAVPTALEVTGACAMTSESCEVGILFSDVAGSTRLYELLGDRAALAAIETCLGVMSEAVRSSGGVVVKTIGDEVMAAFRGVTQMCRAAIAMQRRIQDLPPVAGPRGEIRLSARVGFHYGPALEDAGDFFGDTVNVASRMVGLAKGGQIITTEECVQRLAPAQRRTMRALDSVSLKGKARRVPAVEVLWRDFADQTMIFRSRTTDPTPAWRRLKLRHQQEEWSFGEDRDTITLGREAGNDIVVTDHSASRNHATIERRGDKWVLIDHSTNGTFVTFSDGEELRVYREEVILWGAGVIACGRSAAGMAFEGLRFHVIGAHDA